MARVTAGKLAERAKKIPFAQYERELDVLLGLKTLPNGAKRIDHSVSPDLTHDTLSWADVGEAFCGRDLMKKLRDRRFGSVRGGRWEATEDAGAGAMGPSQFQAINYWSETTAKILEAVGLMQYEQPEFITDKITTLMPGIVQNMGRMSRYSPPTTSAKRKLAPNEPIPMGSMDAEWVDVNPVEKHGQGLAVATESMLFDGKQGEVVSAIQNISYQIGWAKEDRGLRALFGIENTYRYGAADSAGTSTTYNTYQTAAVGLANYVNVAPLIDLLTELDLDTVEQLYLAMKNPRTGYPINVGGQRNLITMPYKTMTGRRLSRMTSIEQGPRTTAPSAVEATSTTWAGPQIIPSASQRAYDLLTTADGAYGWSALTPTQAKYRFVYGDPKKAFQYREARPFQSWSWNMTQDPSLALHDCFMMVVALEQGSVTVVEPRHVVMGTKDS